MATDKKQARQKRSKRVRSRIQKIRGDRMRLTIFRSARHIYAQIIDDAEGKTLVSASTVEKEMRSKIKNGGNTDAAATIGQTIAERALKADIKRVVFDRSGFLYHGRTRKLAEAAREGGLEF
ncbi:MAG: 50S ribosomal protein L18 [Magnetococcales bacterium]|nr:50S ribosomal protein L18 [Magnetococcales bacterium]